jgi:hypothetical protein
MPLGLGCISLHICTGCLGEEQREWQSTFDAVWHATDWLLAVKLLCIAVLSLLGNMMLATCSLRLVPYVLLTCHMARMAAPRGCLQHVPADVSCAYSLVQTIVVVWQLPAKIVVAGRR